VHVRIDNARKRDAVLPVIDLNGAIGSDTRRNRGELAVLDRDIGIL